MMSHFMGVVMPKKKCVHSFTDAFFTMLASGKKVFLCHSASRDGSLAMTKVVFKTWRSSWGLRFILGFQRFGNQC